MKVVTHEELVNKIIGERGTVERENYEKELKTDILFYQLNELKKKDN